MKRNIIFLLTLLLFATGLNAGSLHSGVIDDATTYIDVGYPADNVNVVATKVEVSLKVFHPTVSYDAYHQYDCSYAGIFKVDDIMIEHGWVRYNQRLVVNRKTPTSKLSTNLVRFARDSLSKF